MTQSNDREEHTTEEVLDFLRDAEEFLRNPVVSEETRRVASKEQKIEVVRLPDRIPLNPPMSEHYDVLYVLSTITILGSLMWWMGT